MIRVFPRRTNLTPIDDKAFIGSVRMNVDYDEVYISCTFTWDMNEAERLASEYSQYCTTRLGGPAYGSEVTEFVPGLYLKQGVTFTTRGCNNQCPWCLVPEREGKLRLIDNFVEGYIIQDNNLLQAPRSHIERVISMLKTQNAAMFSGGIDARLVTDWFVEQIQSIRINELFLACDTREAIKQLSKAAYKLRHLNRDKIRCYVLIGKDEPVHEARERLEQVWAVGCMPFAQLYQPPKRKKIEYSREWRDLARTWSRPAAMKTLMSTTNSTLQG